MHESARTLVVTSDPMLREQCRNSLPSLGAVVQTAADVATCQAIIDVAHPSVLLFDCALLTQDWTAWQLLGRLENDVAYRDIEVVLVTSQVAATHQATIRPEHTDMRECQSSRSQQQFSDPRALAR